MKPLVSILIPAYNAENLVAYTLQSAVGQTWPRKEFIVVDDGSTDRTAEVAKRFASKEVKVVSTENQVFPGQSITLIGFAKETTFKSSILTTSWHRTRSNFNWLHCARVTSKRTLLSSPWAHFYFRTRRAQFVPNSLME